MVSLTEIRAHTSTLKTLSPGLVAVFVGGTSGMGLSTARELVRNTQSPHIYLIGRNQVVATQITTELQTLNPSSTISFIKSDVSSLRNVDTVCAEIAAKEKKINILFMTAGYGTLAGRDETPEGLDRKFSLHYYARMRFIQKLSPLLTAAANDPDKNANLSRVVSVLDPIYGRKAPGPNFNDLDLKRTFSVPRCAIHATSMNNFTLEHFASTTPGPSFVHSYPSLVQTGIFTNARWYMKPAIKTLGLLIRPWSVDLTESGERHLFAATAPRFGRGEGSAMGSDEVRGSGSYHLNWDSEVLGESKVLRELREQGARERIWKHTEEVFGQIEKKGKYES
ncbi:hypothetical protein B0J11DRAFT_549876 [Dendryphion nanum]|uniref:Short-chain dehydrogenase/reductase n=1 Tax=Dendryphion nanum TaxID=256645 RepID=A0A9P9DXB3_9PLEO|nr:hypothetical protein B0J11DRAFT_549876 [Dendryphion nanum]